MPNSDPAEPLILSTRDGYDLWAKIYDTEDNALIALEESRIATLLGEVRGLRIADVGCGTGRHAVRLAAAGAHVTALDFSEVMLRHARSKTGANAVEFVRHDLAARLPLADGAVDGVLCCLVVDHIPQLCAFFRELRRISRPDGFVVVSVMHPAMMLRGIQARFHDPATGREIRPQSCAHQISDYVMAALHAGLTFDQLSEHVVDDALALRSPRARKYLGWPLLAMMRLRHVQR